jgi:L-amino acid N-acyltransferase YncA
MTEPGRFEGRVAGPGVKVEIMRDEDWPEVRRVFAEGIATGNATFELEAPSWSAWDAGHRRDCRFVVRGEGGRLLGWAALSPVSGRRVYGGVAEVSVYVEAAARGAGVGQSLLQALVHESERQGVWTLQAGIFPENETSVRLHERLGFRQVGRRERIGRMGDTWRDVLLLERRSAVAGVGPAGEAPRP